MVDVKGLSVQFGNQVILDNLSFSVGSGEFVGIIGPNGSGKSTLLQSLTQWIQPVSGTIHLDGRALHTYSMKERASVVALLSQHMELTLGQTVKDTIALGRYAHKRGVFHQWTEADERYVKEAVDWLDLELYVDRSVADLSGGERQRVAFAQTIVQDPRILLLDEPINHLDVRYQKELLDYVAEWVKSSARTVITVFHDINMAALYCDRLLVLQEGKLRADGEPRAILQQSLIEEVFQTTPSISTHTTVPKPQVMWTPNRLGERGDREVAFDVMERDGFVLLTANTALRTFSSSMTGAPIGWYTHFLLHDGSAKVLAETSDYLHEESVLPYDTMKTKTIGEIRGTVVKKIQSPVPVVVVATQEEAIHLHIFVEGVLSDEQLLHLSMEAAEARGRASYRIGQEAEPFTPGSLTLAATQLGDEVSSAELASVIRALVPAVCNELLER